MRLVNIAGSPHCWRVRAALHQLHRFSQVELIAPSERLSLAPTLEDPQRSALPIQGSLPILGHLGILLPNNNPSSSTVVVSRSESLTNAAQNLTMPLLMASSEGAKESVVDHASYSALGSELDWWEDREGGSTLLTDDPTVPFVLYPTLALLRYLGMALTPHPSLSSFLRRCDVMECFAATRPPHWVWGQTHSKKVFHLIYQQIRAQSTPSVTTWASKRLGPVAGQLPNGYGRLRITG